MKKMLSTLWGVSAAYVIFLILLSAISLIINQGMWMEEYIEKVFEYTPLAVLHIATGIMGTMKFFEMFLNRTVKKFS